MTIAIIVEGDVTHVVLEGELSVAGAKAIQTELLLGVTPESVVILSTERVERVDASVLQLMFGLARYVKAFAVEPRSEAWMLAARHAGMEDVFGGAWTTRDGGDV